MAVHVLDILLFTLKAKQRLIKPCLCVNSSPRKKILCPLKPAQKKCKTCETILFLLKKEKTKKKIPPQFLGDPSVIAEAFLSMLLLLDRSPKVLFHN